MSIECGANYHVWDLLPKATLIVSKGYHTVDCSPSLMLTWRSEATTYVSVRTSNASNLTESVRWSPLLAIW